MELPKIPKERLTKELREVVGETDLEFDSIVDPGDIMTIPDWDGANFWGEKDKYMDMMKKHLTESDNSDSINNLT